MVTGRGRIYWNDMRRYARQLLRIIQEVRKDGYVVLNVSPDSSAMTLRGGHKKKTYYDPRFRLVEVIVDAEALCNLILSTPAKSLSDEERHQIEVEFDYYARTIEYLTGWSLSDVKFI